MIYLTAFYSNALNWLEAHQLPCLFKNIFHVECPGCGIQSSLLALMKGDIGGSLALYPALLPMLAYFIFLFVNSKYPVPGGKKITVWGCILIFIIILTSFTFRLFNQN